MYILYLYLLPNLLYITFLSSINRFQDINYRKSKRNCKSSTTCIMQHTAVHGKHNLSLNLFIYLIFFRCTMNSFAVYVLSFWLNPSHHCMCFECGSLCTPCYTVNTGFRTTFPMQWSRALKPATLNLFINYNDKTIYYHCNLTGMFFSNITEVYEI